MESKTHNATSGQQPQQANPWYTRFRGQLLILLGAVLWSTGGMGIKLLDGYSAIGVSAGRSALAAALFFVMLRGHVAIPTRWRRWIVSGALIYAGVVVCFVVSHRLTTAANAILLKYTAPLWIALIGWKFSGERPAPNEIPALAIGGIGIFLCASGELTFFGSGPLLTRAFLGDLLALASGLGFALFNLTMRSLERSMAEERSRAAGKAGGSADLSSATAAMLVLFYGSLLAALAGLPALARDLARPGIVGHSQAAGILLLLWLGIGQMAGGAWFYIRGLRTTPALSASLLALVEPVLAPVWVAVAIGEFPSHVAFLGGSLVLVSILMSQVRRHHGRVVSSPASGQPPFRISGRLFAGGAHGSGSLFRGRDVDPVVAAVGDVIRIAPRDCARHASHNGPQS